MKEVILKLDYGAFPVWVYSENELEDNDLPLELKSDKELDDKLVKLQEKYEKLFTNDSTEFKYNGFKTEKEKKEFITEANNIASELGKKLKGIYRVVNNFSI